MDRVIALFLGLRNPISHEPVLSEDIKTALKTQLFPRHIAQPGPPQNDRGKDRWISHGGLQMRVKKHCERCWRGGQPRQGHRVCISVAKEGIGWIGFVFINGSILFRLFCFQHRLYFCCSLAANRPTRYQRRPDRRQDIACLFKLQKEPYECLRSSLVSCYHCPVWEVSYVILIRKLSAQLSVLREKSWLPAPYISLAEWVNCFLRSVPVV